MKSDTPVFKSAGELAATLDALKKTSPSKQKDITKGKTSMTLADLFESLRRAKGKQESDRLIQENKLLADLAAGKPARRLIHLKLNPALAHISDKDGRVQVGDRVFDILAERDTQDLMMMMPLPEPDPDPGGGGSGGSTSSYVFTDAPPEELVEWLPCGPWTVLPGYPTHFFDAKIGGRVVILQMWKGSCPDYLGWTGSPGGVGAEVGIYNRDSSQPHLLWWPDNQHEKLIDFTLFNPVTTQVFFSASSSAPIWWLHKWMKFPSYDQYVKDQQNRVPATTEEYVLRFRIDGKQFEW